MKYHMVYSVGNLSIPCYTEQLMDYDILCNMRINDPDKEIEVIVPTENKKRMNIRCIELEDFSVFRVLNMFRS